MHFRLRSLAFLAFVAPASIAHANDWIVDDQAGPGVDFTTIQAAIDAAQTGDHVLVRSGSYAGFVVDGKGLVVAEATGATATIHGMVRIVNVPAGAGVQCIGFTIQGQAPLPGLAITSNAGSVLLSRCTIRGFSGAFPSDAGQVFGSSRALFESCDLSGGDAWFTSFVRGAQGLVSSNSSIELHGCTVRGGRGGSDAADENDDLYSGQVGGSGLVLQGSSAFAERSTVHGGDGGDSEAGVFDERCPGNGGTGVVVNASTLTRYLSTFAGGHIGIDMGFPYCTSGVSDGSPIDPPGAATDVARTKLCFGAYDRCPCGNESVGGSGCDNSFDSGGAALDASGNTSVASDTLTLTVQGIGPSAPALFFQGTSAASSGAGSAMGDGLRCASGTVRRLGSRTASGGVASIGFAAGDPSLAAGGLVTAGATRVYQAWYRNAASFCTPAAFNFTNGVEIRWDP